MASKKAKKNNLSVFWKLLSDESPEGRRKLTIVSFKYIVVIGLLGFILGAAYTFGTSFEKTITIKERPPLGVEQNKRVKSLDGDWYMVADNVYQLKFRSFDTWGDLEEGQTYKVKGYGWRVGFFSMFPNIVDIEKITN